MTTKKCFRLFKDNPIIPAVRNPRDIYEAVSSKPRVIFLLCGNIYNLKKIVEYVKASDKIIFVHLDLLKGFAQDTYFIKYLKNEIAPHGVISTKNALVSRAKQEGMLTVQRLFLLDSSAMDVSITSANKIKPDAVEILPGLVPKLIRSIHQEIQTPIITGGFVETREEVLSCIQAGALSVTTSTKELWQNYEKIKPLIDQI